MFSRPEGRGLPSFTKRQQFTLAKLETRVTGFGQDQQTKARYYFCFVTKVTDNGGNKNIDRLRRLTISADLIQSKVSQLTNEDVLLISGLELRLIQKNPSQPAEQRWRGLSGQLLDKAADLLTTTKPAPAKLRFGLLRWFKGIFHWPF